MLFSAFRIIDFYESVYKVFGLKLMYKL